MCTVIPDLIGDLTSNAIYYVIRRLCLANFVFRPGFPGKTWPVPRNNGGPARNTGLFLSGAFGRAGRAGASLAGGRKLFFVQLLEKPISAPPSTTPTHSTRPPYCLQHPRQPIPPHGPCTPPDSTGKRARALAYLPHRLPQSIIFDRCPRNRYSTHFFWTPVGVFGLLGLFCGGGVHFYRTSGRFCGHLCR